MQNNSLLLLKLKSGGSPVFKYASLSLLVLEDVFILMFSGAFRSGQKKSKVSKVLERLPDSIFASILIEDPVV